MSERPDQRQNRLITNAIAIAEVVAGRFKVGDTVRYQESDVTGIVYQAEGGAEGQFTEVYWPRFEQASWVLTKFLNPI